MPENLYIEEGSNQNKSAKGDRLIVDSGTEIRIKSGGKLIAESGSTVSLAAGATEPGDIALTTGSILLGTAGVAAELDAKTSGRILVGSGTTLASVAVSGDMTLSSAGAATIAASALVSGNASYIKTANGAQTALIAAGAAAQTRHVIINVTVTEVFADGDGTQPTFTIGETGAATKFAAASKFTGAAAGDTFSFGGVLTAETALFVTAVAATGATSTGAIDVTVIGVKA